MECGHLYAGENKYGHFLCGCFQVLLADCCTRCYWHYVIRQVHSCTGVKWATCHSMFTDISCHIILWFLWFLIWNLIPMVTWIIMACIFHNYFMIFTFLHVGSGAISLFQHVAQLFVDYTNRILCLYMNTLYWEIYIVTFWWIIIMGNTLKTYLYVVVRMLLNIHYWQLNVEQELTGMGPMEQNAMEIH